VIGVAGHTVIYPGMNPCPCRCSDRQLSSRNRGQMEKRLATCACGQLRVGCEGEPVRVSICNCTQCQKRTGSVYGVGAYFPASAITNIEGETRGYTRNSEAGRWLKMSFCPECGTTVYWEAEFRPGFIGVAVGTFDQRDIPEPVAVVWADHRFPWAAFPEGVPVHGRQPE
jgi:hypothetical protein